MRLRTGFSITLGLVAICLLAVWASAAPEHSKVGKAKSKSRAAVSGAVAASAAASKRLFGAAFDASTPQTTLCGDLECPFANGVCCTFSPASRHDSRPPTCCPNGYQCHFPKSKKAPVTCEEYFPPKTASEKREMIRKLHKLREQKRKLARKHKQAVHLWSSARVKAAHGSTVVATVTSGKKPKKGRKDEVDALLDMKLEAGSQPSKVQRLIEEASDAETDAQAESEDA